MRKVRLDLNSLEVESFSTGDAAAVTGTIRGRESDGSLTAACCQPSCGGMTCETCQAADYGTQCGNTCYISFCNCANTNGETCPQTCYAHTNCGDSCVAMNTCDPSCHWAFCTLDC